MLERHFIFVLRKFPGSLLVYSLAMLQSSSPKDALVLTFEEHAWDNITVAMTLAAEETTTVAWTF